MATNTELKGNKIIADLHIAERENAKIVKTINGWYQWAQGLPPPISIPVQILDIGFPEKAQREGEANSKYTIELIRELSEIMPKVPGKYGIGDIVYHPHAQDDEAKFTAGMWMIIGKFYCAGEFASNELVIKPTKDEDGVIEIKADQPPVLSTRLKPEIKVCMDHENELKASWLPRILKDKPTPLIPALSEDHWVNLGVYNPFNRMLIEKYNQNVKATHLEDNDNDDPFSIDHYRAAKQIGVFFVHHNTSIDDWGNSEIGFDLNKGEKFLEFHLPDSEQYEKAHDRTNFYKNARDSLKLMAGYIQRHNLETKWVLGTTDERLARAGRIFGFETMQIPIDDELRSIWEDSFLENNPRFQPENQPKGRPVRPVGNFLLAYQSLDNFLARFAQ
jgi:hypothetical protein